MIAATLFLWSKVRVDDRKSFSSLVESWKLSWMWSSPASLSARARFSVRPMPEVMRLV
ncbi:hypothetical protein X551_04219 [Methylibium sp. T29]|nr:hypothetical protein X551_04219 [Methylibium sp. T29]EWS57897.1 hypothetical protein Y694_04183 [Methylibium sp. T29-B]